MWKCSAPIKVACAQTRSVPIKLYGILGGSGGGKGDRAQNCWKFTPISGADALSAPPLCPIIEWKWKCSAPIKAPGAQTRSVPLKRHGSLRGRGAGKGARSQNRWKYTSISGAERGPGLQIGANLHRFLAPRRWVYPLYTKYKYWMWKCSATFKAHGSQTRSVSIKPHQILWGTCIYRMSFHKKFSWYILKFSCFLPVPFPLSIHIHVCTYIFSKCWPSGKTPSILFYVLLLKQLLEFCDLLDTCHMSFNFHVLFWFKYTCTILIFSLEA